MSAVAGDGSGIEAGTVVYDAESGECGKVTWISRDDPDDVIAKVDFGDGETGFVNLEDLVRAAGQSWPE